ncbi:MAG: glycine zipper domain-containing protein [Nocardioidaceae bacterium]
MPIWGWLGWAVGAMAGLAVGFFFFDHPVIGCVIGFALGLALGAAVRYKRNRQARTERGSGL